MSMLKHSLIWINLILDLTEFSAKLYTHLSSTSAKRELPFVDFSIGWFLRVSNSFFKQTISSFNLSINVLASIISSLLHDKLFDISSNSLLVS